MNALRGFFIGLVLLLSSARPADAGQGPALTKILASVEQLGRGWTSNNLVVMLDPLSSPSEASESPNWMDAARRVVGKRGCQAYGVVRYFHGKSSSLVWIYRYGSTTIVRTNWPSYEPAKAPPSLPKVGDERRFSHRHGMHNNVTFSRGCFLIDVESGRSIGFDELNWVEEVFDHNLLEAQKNK